MPLLLLLVLALAQVGLIVQAQISTTHAAREVARVLAVDPAADAQGAAAIASNLKADATTVDVVYDTGAVSGRSAVEVTITYAVPSVSPLVDALIGSHEVEATAVMLAEWP